LFFRPPAVDLEASCHRLVHRAVVDDGADLFERAESQRIEVHRADEGEPFVDDHGLGVHHRGLVLEDARALLRERTVQALLRSERGLRITLRARDQDADIDAAGGFRFEQRQQRARRDEVGVGDPDSPFCRLEKELGDAFGPGQHRRGGARDEGDPALPGVQLGEVGEQRRGEERAACFEPVLSENLRGVVDRRALDAHSRVAPVIVALAVAEPVVADAEPAGQGDAAIDEDELAVIALELRAPWQRAKPFHFAASVDELRARPLRVEERAAAKIVDDDAARDALAAARHERLDDPIGGAPGFPDVHDDAHALAGARDGLDDGVDHRAVVAQVDVVAGVHHHTEALEKRRFEAWTCVRDVAQDQSSLFGRGGLVAASTAAGERSEEREQHQSKLRARAPERLVRGRLSRSLRGGDG
jgi:hypothetical protein